MDIWAQLWPNPYVNGKVHKSVVRGILDKLDDLTDFGTIYAMVELSGISDDSDKLATARAIRDQRDIRRVVHKTARLAITA